MSREDRDGGEGGGIEEEIYMDGARIKGVINGNPRVLVVEWRKEEWRVVDLLKVFHGEEGGTYDLIVRRRGRLLILKTSIARDEGFEGVV